MWGAAVVSEGRPGEPRKDDESAVGPESGTHQSGYRFGPGTLQPGRGANSPGARTPDGETPAILVPDGETPATADGRPRYHEGLSYVYPSAAPPPRKPAATPQSNNPVTSEDMPAATQQDKARWWRRDRPNYVRVRGVREGPRVYVDYPVDYPPAATPPGNRAAAAPIDEEAAASLWQRPEVSPPPAPEWWQMSTPVAPARGAPGERNSRTIPQDVKIQVSARDHGMCVQCGSTQDLHFDHKIPWSRGGTNTVNNIQLLCGPCNRRKGADDIPVW